MPADHVWQRFFPSPTGCQFIRPLFTEAMPIEFRCTGCEKLLRTADHTSGLPAKCPECGTLQTIPDYGSPLNLAAKSSPKYHESGTPEPNYQAGNRFGDDNAAVMSVLLGVTAFMTSCCLPIAFPVSLVGLMLGIRSMGSRNRFMAIVGTVLSLLGIITTVSMTFWLLFRS